MKKTLKTVKIVLFSMFILFIMEGNCFADLVMPGQSGGDHGVGMREIPYEMTTKPSIWKFILIGMTIITIVNIVILIIMKKSKQKKEKESNDKTNNN